MIDVFTLGEAMIRLSTPPGETLEKAKPFDVHVGGAEANVAASLARLGRRVSWVSALPADPLGRRVLEELQAAGVDCSHVRIDTNGRIGTYFVDLRNDPLAASVIYDRRGSAASLLRVDDIPWSLVDEARIVHVSGITPALSPSCREVAAETAARAADGPSMLTFDINYRSKLWPPSQAADALSDLARLADVVVCTLEDAHQLFGASGDAVKAVNDLADRFDTARVVVTSGAEGAWWVEDGSAGHVPALPVEVVDRIGAGDAFMAGVLDGLIDGSLDAGVRRGTALAALALSTHGDHPMASRDELDSLLEGPGRRVDR